MAQRKVIMTVEAISDDGSGMYRIGEIDTLPHEDVQKFLDQYGEHGYQELRDFFIKCLVAAEHAIAEDRKLRAAAVGGEYTATGGHDD